MGVRCLSISAVCTLLSFIGLQYWTELSLQKLTSYGSIGMDFFRPGNAFRQLSSSQVTIALLANLALNIFVLLILGLKTIFFTELHASETWKLVERLVNYVIYKGTFLPLIVPPTIFQVCLWSTWLIILCSLKMFQALARDRLEQLNASPSATPWTYFRVYSALLFVISSDLLWIKMCLLMHRTLESHVFLLLFFEPLSIAFETLQAIVVHGFQLLDIWLLHSAGNSSNCHMSKLFDVSASGSLWEWKCILSRNLGFFLDMMTLLMALGHYVHIWWLHGMAFDLVDAVLFLNIRALLGAIIKHMKGFIRLRIALGALHGALPDATSEEIRAYNDDCAICREPMAKAKRLSCNHLFHLACLRSWMDQGLNGNYSCPTCRKPLHLGRSEDEANPRTVHVSTNEQLALQLSSVLDPHNPPGHTVPTQFFPNQMRDAIETGARRRRGLDSTRLRSWTGQGLDVADPSTGSRPVGLGRVQMMMRLLAAVGETYDQTTLEDGAWSLWPIDPSQPGTSNSPVAAGSARYPGNVGGLHMTAASEAENDNISNILAMAGTVREDLQRTNSVTVTVNNLLQM
ncbi:E3 ubiquitin protein ligase RIN2-like isoform X2 [Diospyros lotus]|uniref:E3 ubiquitin protein ligase RIN2-like isoform X2 n=1 Tax=Diospyros lotus TaxID=55363 RepID=UPI00225BABC8|nr:E3 ubiquitin protein ligase RIN2-like isoform X2 [Diospyros lotus]